jgi:type IV pilus assembly protein PilN
MRVRINLLPHRQIKRAERQRQFGLMVVMVVVSGLVIIFTGYSYISADINAQNSRNQRLKTANTELDGKIKEIQVLQEKIGELKERIQAVESLQNNRSLAVAMLDEIARRLPDGISLRGLTQKGDLITLEGVADTNARVATLVGNLSTSTILVSPQLVEVKSISEKNMKISTFTVTVKLKSVTPESASNTSPANPKGGKA